MKPIIGIFTIFHLIFGTPVFAQGGSNAGGGGDCILHTSSWFRTSDPNRPVKTCVEVSTDFGYSMSDLSTKVKNAFQHWVDYGKQKGLFDEYVFNAPPATKIEVVQGCKGDEDLSIYFGVTTPELIKRKSKYVTPYCFAELNKPLRNDDIQAEWSPGLLWFAAPGSASKKFVSPLWTNYEGAPLEAAILHEMGHVFGVPHADGSIMRPDFGNILAEETQKSRAGRTKDRFEYYPIRIDAEYFLAMNGGVGFKLPIRVDHSCSSDWNGVDRVCIEKMERLVISHLLGANVQASRYQIVLEHKGKESLDPVHSTLDPIKEFNGMKMIFKGDSHLTALTFRPFLVLDSETEYSVYIHPNGARGRFRSYSLYGDLIDSNGSKRQVILNLNQDRRFFGLVDPSIPLSSPICMDRYPDGTCNILKVDENRLASDEWGLL